MFKLFLSLKCFYTSPYLQSRLGWSVVRIWGLVLNPRLLFCHTIISSNRSIETVPSRSDGPQPVDSNFVHIRIPFCLKNRVGRSGSQGTFRTSHWFTGSFEWTRRGRGCGRGKGVWSGEGVDMWKPCTRPLLQKINWGGFVRVSL